LVLGAIVMPVLSCSGSRPTNLGVKNLRLAPCPSTPNCVSSDGEEPSQRVSPFQLAAPAAEAWRAARAAVLSLPRTQIVAETGGYLHAECRSAVFGFVDDLELHLRPAQGMIAVRSAARLGYSDFGVNRRRIERLRARLARQGVVR
jgi:uncharacterized protein (DUF1499 family)